MATVEVMSTTSAFQEEKMEEPISKQPQVQTNSTDQDVVNAPVAEPTPPAQPVEETESTVVDEPDGEPAAAVEAETLATEVEAKVVVVDEATVPEEEPAAAVQGESAKVAPEPEPELDLPAVEETKDTTVINAVEAEPADSKVVDEEEKPADEAAAAATEEKSDE